MGGSAVYGDGPSLKAAVGESIGGFTLVRQLGAGGMGETWEAVRHVGPEFEQRVAVKLGSAEMLRHEEGRDLLRREASLAASLRHPNIAAVLDWNEERGFIICELVEGVDLRAVLREAPGGRFSPPLLVYMITQIARGLSHAHRRLLRGQPSPVVHRDMSPANVVVDYDGNLKIVDFGIAKAIGSADWSQTIKGKLAYMAPEQATGGPLDGRVDQYALGVMAYEAATSVRPNDGAHDGETLARILEGNHIPVGRLEPSLPSGLAEIIERMLALRPEQRFASMDAVIDALEPLTPGLTVHRSLAALVHRAQPPHTIVEEGGRFVSRPVVSFELPPNDPLALGSKPAHTPSNVRSVGSARSKQRDVASVSPFHPTEGYAYPPPREQPAEPRPGRARGSDIAVMTPAFGGRRMLLLAGGVMALSAVVAWAALSPTQSSQGEVTSQGAKRATDATSSPGAAAPAAPPPASKPQPRSLPEQPPAIAQPPLAIRAPKNSETTAVPPRRPEPAASAAAPASLRVKVFPWGRVWIDGKVRGSVPPILSVKLPPGTHTVAVGHEEPSQTRVVTITAGGNQLVSFDLESW